MPETIQITPEDEMNRTHEDFDKLYDVLKDDPELSRDSALALGLAKQLILTYKESAERGREAATAMSDANEIIKEQREQIELLSAGGGHEITAGNLEGGPVHAHEVPGEENPYKAIDNPGPERRPDEVLPQMYFDEFNPDGHK